MMMQASSPPDYDSLEPGEVALTPVVIEVSTEDHPRQDIYTVQLLLVGG